MRWPWPRRTSEVEWLRERVAYLEDQLVRLERRREGLPETPRESRQVEPMPSEIVRYIRGFPHAKVREDMRRQAIRRHAAGEPWDAIAADILGPKEEEGES